VYLYIFLEGTGRNTSDFGERETSQKRKRLLLKILLFSKPTQNVRKSITNLANYLFFQMSNVHDLFLLFLKGTEPPGDILKSTNKITKEPVVRLKEQLTEIMNMNQASFKIELQEPNALR
jgi:hypothetical protein